MIVDRYLDEHVPLDCPGLAGVCLEEQQGRNVRLLNNELAQVLQQLEATRRVSHEVRRLLQANQSQNWWEKPINELTDLPQLDHLRVALLEIRKDVTRQAEKIMIDMARAIPQQQRSSYGACSSARRVYLYNDKTVATTSAVDSMNPPPLPQLPAMLSPPGHNFGCDNDGFY
ncbi:hypothetical protein MLD38_023270 [Melastoma candidum]|nr:hypothetical protein MLD38_023270 [Melastoma candidum]